MPFRKDSLIKFVHDAQTDIKKDMFIEALKRLHNVSVVCEVIKISRAMVYEWRNEDPDFKHRWEEAIQFSKEALESATYLKAIKGNTAPAITASIFLLKGMYPEKYSERVDMTQRVSFTIDWSRVSDETLDKFNAGELTLLDVYNSTIQQNTAEHSASAVGRTEGSRSERSAEASESSGE